MAQGEFTKEECDATLEAVSELFKALPKGKQAAFLGHLNDISLFLGAARVHAYDSAVEANSEAFSRQCDDDDEDAGVR